MSKRKMREKEREYMDKGANAKELRNFGIILIIHDRRLSGVCKRFHSAIVFYFKPLFLSNISQVLVSYYLLPQYNVSSKYNVFRAHVPSVF